MVLVVVWEVQTIKHQDQSTMERNGGAGHFARSQETASCVCQQKANLRKKHVLAKTGNP